VDLGPAIASPVDLACAVALATPPKRGTFAVTHDDERPQGKGEFTSAALARMVGIDAANRSHIDNPGLSREHIGSRHKMWC